MKQNITKMSANYKQLQRGKAWELIFSRGKELVKDRKGRNTNYFHCFNVCLLTPYALWSDF